MKHVNFLLPLLSLTVIVTVTAFTYTNVDKTSVGATENKAEHFKNRASAVDLPYYDFVYTGPSSPLYFSDYTDPDNYTLIEYPSIICEYGVNSLCAINCEGDWNGWEIKPVFNDEWWKTKAQLYTYYLSGLAGPTLYLKY